MNEVILTIDIQESMTAKLCSFVRAYHSNFGKLDYILMSKEEARELAVKEGIFAGSSSGAALAAAKKLIVSGVCGNIVIILPNRSDRYFSKHLYN